MSAFSELDADIAAAVVDMLMDDATYTPAATGVALPTTRAAVSYLDVETGHIRSHVQAIQMPLDGVPADTKREDSITVLGATYKVSGVVARDSKFITFSVRAS